MYRKIEKEIKYLIPKENFDEVNFLKDLEKLLNVKSLEEIVNTDIYYDFGDVLENYHISVRKRTTDGNECWNLKVPYEFSDESKFLCRYEYEFSSLDEILSFILNSLKIPIKTLIPKIAMITNRKKQIIDYDASSLEVAFDNINFGNEEESLKLLEIELLDGWASNISLFDDLIAKYGLRKMDCSKIEYISKVCNYDKKKNPFKKPNKIDYDDYVKHFFVANQRIYDELKNLQERKQRIISYKEYYGDLSSPIVVTLSGTPRAGKTTCIENLFEFFKKADIKTKCLEEPAGLVYQTLKSKEEKKKLLEDRVGFVHQQYDIGKSYIDNNIADNEIILCDRGIIDTFFWYDMYYQLGMISTDDYQNYLKRLEIINRYNNMFFALYASEEESMRRDYLSSLSIEPRTTMNLETVEKFNCSILRMMPIIKEKIENTTLLNTTTMDKMDPSIIVANSVLDQVEAMYLKRSKKDVF